MVLVKHCVYAGSGNGATEALCAFSLHGVFVLLATLCPPGTVLVASAYHIAQLVIGRLVLGVGVGFATQATPLYLSEMAPYNLRGALNILFQLAVTIGIFVAQIINYGTQVSVAHLHYMIRYLVVCSYYSIGHD